VLRALPVLLVLLAAPAWAQSTQTRTPTADGTDHLTAWSVTAPGAECVNNTDEWNCVNDSSDASYLSWINSNGNMWWEYTDFAISSSAITNIQVVCRGQEGAAEAITIRGWLRVNGNNDLSSGQDLTTAFADYTFTWTTNPEDSAPWEESEVEGGGTNPLQEFGCRCNMTTGETCDIAEASITVTYTAAGGGGTPTHLTMTGVGVQ
jgi:hypothetical protein